MTVCETRAGAESRDPPDRGGRRMPPRGWVCVGVALVCLDGLDLWGL